jgi:beta-ureidopropionase / N-carbamoyl-L-amino-acid hydrolase
MLFAPCRDGISHDPAEWADPAAAAAGVEVLLHAVAELARVRAD